MADANGKQIVKNDLISMKFGTRRLSRSLITHLNLKFKKANLVKYTKCKKWLHLDKILYLRVSEIADYASDLEIRNSEWRM